MYTFIIHKYLNTITNNSKMTITDLMNEFNISKEQYIGSVISNKFIGDDSTNEVISKLKKYDIYTLKHIEKSMRKDSQDLYEKIMKRRQAYIDKVRRIHKIKKEQNRLNGVVDDNSSESNWIDFSDNGDDTENLVCGMNVISKGIDKINLIIENKKRNLNVVENMKDKLHVGEDKTQIDYYSVMGIKVLMVATTLILGAKMLF